MTDNDPELHDNLSFRQQLREAAVIVKSKPWWQQNLLHDSSTCKTPRKPIAMDTKIETTGPPLHEQLKAEIRKLKKQNAELLEALINLRKAVSKSPDDGYISWSHADRVARELIKEASE